MQLEESANPLFHKEWYRVRGYDVDLKKRASIPALIQMMHDAAMEHVLRIGLSAFELEAHDLGWVLVRQRLEIHQLPTLGATIHVHTYPTGRERILAYRDFYLMDAAGLVLATMSTSWLLMNTRTRKVAGYPDFILEWLEKTQAAAHLARPQMVWPAGAGNPVVEKIFRVDWYALDFNRHLSNYYYQRWMLEALPSDVLENRSLEVYEIQFKGECHLEDELQVSVEALGKGEYIHRVRKGEKDLAIGWSKWNE